MNDQVDQNDCFNQYLFLMWRRYQLNLFRRRTLTKRNYLNNCISKLQRCQQRGPEIKELKLEYHKFDLLYDTVREQLKTGTPTFQRLSKMLKIKNNWDQNGNIQSIIYMNTSFSYSDYKKGHDKYITEYIILCEEMPISPYDREEVMNEF